MSAYLSIQSYAPDSSEYVLVNGPPFTWLLMEEADWGNAAWEHLFSGARGTQGARPSQGVPQNRKVIIPLKYFGTTQDDAAARTSELHAVVDELRRFGGRITRRAHRQTYRQHFDVMVADHALAEWGKRAENTNLYRPIITAQCAPYVLGDAMGYVETFDAAASADRFEVVSGTGSLVAVGGKLDTSGSSAVAPVIALESLRGYLYSDVYLRTEVYVDGGGFNTDQSNGLVLKWVDASNHIQVSLLNASSGATKVLRITVTLGGVARNVDVTRNVSNPGLNGGRDVLLAWLDGNQIKAETHPFGADSPYNSNASIYFTTASTFLTAAEAAVLGAEVEGRVGLRFAKWRTLNFGTGPYTFASFEVRPFYYQGYTWPLIDRLDLKGRIPGDAPALAEVTVTQPHTSSAFHRFAMVGWSPRPKTWNRVWNGDGENPNWSGARGWVATAVTGVTVAATSVGKASGASLSGTSDLVAVTPATINAGVAFKLQGRFRRGVTYTARLYVRQTPSGGATLVLGVNGDLATATNVINTSANLGVLATVTWTPAADVTTAYVGLRNTTATAATAMFFDEVQVYEGTTPPSAFSQQAGAGAHPPIGVLLADQAEDFTGLSATADATALTGQRWGKTVSGAGSMTLSWPVDPALITPDDYTQGELDVEVWLRVLLDPNLVGPRVYAWTNPIAATPLQDVFGTRRFTRGFGSRGRPITLPTADAWRLVRVGVVPMVVNRDDPTLWRVAVQVDYQAGSSNNIAMDYALLVPARSRILSPTGEDTTAGGYPDFFNQAGLELTKTVRADLSATIGYAPYRGRFPDHGLGGSSLLEIPSGDVTMAVLLSSTVPDDTSSSSVADAGLAAAAIDVNPTPRWAILRDA